MQSDIFQSASWYLATTLSERLPALRAAPRPPSWLFDPRRSIARMQHWRAQAPLDTSAVFAQRLASEPMTEAELRQLLGEPAEAVAARTSPPSWLTDLEQFFDGREQWEPARLPPEWHGADNIGFLDAVAPLLAGGRAGFRAGVDDLLTRYPNPPFALETIEDIAVASLPAQLRRMLARTLVLELNVARLRGQLAGDSPEERFASFLARLRQRESALTLLREYPVLLRQAALCIRRWCACSLEFLEHLCADREALADLLPEDGSGKLAAIQGNAGDTHRGGRAVLIACFESGARVVYKPKALTVDRHFQELLAWINAQDPSAPAFRTVRVLDRGDHGWVEYVAAGGCDSEVEVQRFYERQGGYLALLYALEATDFHSENLIAAGEHPVLIDLEALFHPRTLEIDPTRADEVAAHALDYSVLRVGLLPRLVWSSEASGGVDVSGLGAVGGQLTPFPVARMEGGGTDSMRLVRVRIEMPADANRPTLHGRDVELVDYTEDITRGFERVYRLLQKHRDTLLAPGGRIAVFANDEVRVILRETQTYSVLLYESYHPDVLRDALDRDRLLDRLWIGSVDDPSLARVIPSERADLLQGDIPMFTTRPGSRDLHDSTGTRLPDFFTESGLELVARRLTGFGDEDLTRQRWILRASLATTARAGAMPSFALPEPREPAQRDALLAEACALGDRLESLALRGGSGASWLGLDLVAEHHWSLEPLGTDLYNGLPGVALFLARLGELTGERRYTTLAASAVETLLRQVEPGRGTIGGFDGWGGIVYTLAHLGTLWDRVDLLNEATRIAAHLPALIEKDEAFDIISGAAGCLAGLLSLEQVASSGTILAAAVACGDHLLARAVPAGQGLAWTPSIPARAPLTGFSHGAAGMACALLELAARSGDDRYHRASLGALAYERGVFSSAAENWPDYRSPEDAPPAEADATLPDEFFLSWCHGAPGIGLARLSGLRHLDDPTVRAEIDVAVRSTLRGGFGRNHSLCHGDLGNLEVLLEAGRRLDDAAWRLATDRLTSILLESIRRDGWLCAAPRAIEAPGLMTGLAGIGMGLLRLADPDRVPSVLVFAPPQRG